MQQTDLVQKGLEEVKDKDSRLGGGGCDIWANKVEKKLSGYFMIGV
jgi:hypothetical protein